MNQDQSIGQVIIELENDYAEALRKAGCLRFAIETLRKAQREELNCKDAAANLQKLSAGGAN